MPGFRKGKVPSAVIDQRVGRGAVLNEAVQEAIPEHILAAVREHEVKTLGRPEVEITEFGDGEPLKFTAEVDVRPEITIPDLSGIEVTVDELRDRRRARSTSRSTACASGSPRSRPSSGPAAGGRLRPDRPEGHRRRRGGAGRLGDQHLPRGRQQAAPARASTRCSSAWSPAPTTSFTTQLVGGDFAGRDADVAVTVRTRQGEASCPPLDDEFAQLASEFDTLEELRGDLRERVDPGQAGRADLRRPRQGARGSWSRPPRCRRRRASSSDEVEHRKQAMADQLERIGASLEEYLAAEEQDRGADRHRADRGGRPRASRSSCCWTRSPTPRTSQVSDDEFGHEIVHRAQRAGMQPQQYYDQLVRSGAAAAVFGDVRRRQGARPR